MARLVKTILFVWAIWNWVQLLIWVPSKATHRLFSYPVAWRHSSANSSHSGDAIWALWENLSLFESVHLFSSILMAARASSKKPYLRRVEGLATGRKKASSTRLLIARVVKCRAASDRVAGLEPSVSFSFSWALHLGKVERNLEYRSSSSSLPAERPKNLEKKNSLECENELRSRAMRQAIEMLLSYCIKRRLRQVSRSKLETTEQQNPNSTIELQDANPMRGQIDGAEGSKESNEATRGHTSGAQINCYKGSKLTDKSSQRFFGLARVREPRDESNSCAKRRKLKAQQAKILSTNDDRRQTMMKSKRSNANFHLAVLLAIIIFELLINVLPESRLELSVSDKTRPPSTLINYLFRNSHFASMLTSSGLPSIKLAEAQSYKPEWPNAQLQQEIFLLNLEDGYFGCQVNESQDYLQLFELSRLCDGQPQCYLGSDELSSKLKCNRRDKCSQIVNLRGQSEYMPCVNGVCLDGLCYCNDGFGGKSCDVPDENECKFRPCDVFAHCTNTMGSYYCSCFPGE